MPTFVSLVKWTDQGMRNAKDTVARIHGPIGVVERHGGKMLSYYWTQGAYDLIMTYEAPDDLTASAMMLSIAAGGYVTTQTLRAFTEPEMEQIIKKMG
jgi:uncharacterized protein with GYD domain